MARRTEKEETEFKVVPEAVSLCVNCGVAGISAANNLCQNCCNAPTAASTSAVSSAAAVSLSSSVAAAKPSNHVNFEKSLRSSSSNLSLLDRRLASAGTSRDLKKEVSVAALPMKREVNRCSGCRRKIGLTGFRCRCGELFCADHRYSDRHDCSYDYKTAGREAIARENPVVKAVKIVKI